MRIRGWWRCCRRDTASLSSVTLCCLRCPSLCHPTTPRPPEGLHSGGPPGFNCQGCGGACSASLPWLLQPSVCGVENLGVVASGHRSLDPQSLRGCVAFQDGDHSGCTAFNLSGRLDGLHRSQGGLPTGSNPSGISPLSPLCGTRQSLSVHSAVLWPLHGSAGFLLGHGSCFHNSPFLGYPHALIPRRLACPVVLQEVSPPGPPGGAGPLSGVGHCAQPREVQP